MSRTHGKDGVWEKRTIFHYYQLDETGAGAYFSTSQTKTDTPTLYMDGPSPARMKSGIIRRIHYRLNPTNAVTFTLRLWTAAIAADYEENLHMLYESPALRADDVDYDITELVTPFILGIPGRIYYSIEWSGAPGVTPGFISVEGEDIE